MLVLRSASICENRHGCLRDGAHAHRRPLFLDADKMTAPNSEEFGSDGRTRAWFCSRQLLPVFCYELGPGEKRVLPAFRIIRSHAGVCGEDGTVESSGETPLSWKLGVPSPEERQQLGKPCFVIVNWPRIWPPSIVTAAAASLISDGWRVITV